jgi:hypothetical protein
MSMPTQPDDARRSSEPAVRGVFRDRDAVARAVRRLTAESVPVDSIRVLLVDGSGQARREIPIEDEAGALRGALVGAGVGAAVGVVLVLVAAVGLVGSEMADLFGIAGMAGAVRAISVCALAGMPLGTILGMGRWDARRHISERDVTTGEVHVMVESARLATLARGILESAGAERVE